MRLKVMCLLIWALLLAQAASRPQQTGPETLTTEVTKELDEDARSRVEPTSKLGLKEYHHMDQALRTVTTQLLNVSEPDDIVGVKNEKIQPKLSLLIRKPDRVIPPSRDTVNQNQKNEINVIKEINSDASPVIIGRPVNSKYSFFESSHPGQAMALTEEELEKELASTRFPISHKHQATTTGGLSTWILLNSPSTTTKLSATDGKKKLDEVPTTKAPISLTASMKIETTPQVDSKTTVPLQKIATSSATATKVTSPKKTFTTMKPERTTTSMDNTTTQRSEARSTSPGPLSTLRSTKIQDEEATTVKTTTKKIVTTSRSTLRPKSTTPKSTTIVSKTTTMKIVRPSQSRPSKPVVIRKSTTAKPDEKVALNSTSKIEKVTFKPVPMITTPKSTVESVPKPMFITKIQASLQTDDKSSSSVPSSTEINLKNEKANDSSSDQFTGKNKASKPNNILKVNLKKPVDSPTTIEIEPIKVNTPVLTIEKIADKTENKEDIKNDLDSLDLENSKVDIKFDFSPELTKIGTPSLSTTTKRPKTSSKRKKNKVRRRRPSLTTAAVSSTTASPNSSTPIFQEIPQNFTVSDSSDTSLQESKIVPDSKVPSNKTNKKKQVAKPIGTQIYNFLSREVMPSVGVMSLVGLGLGLASYFLYPFGGTIARRNYEVEPNYKYNPEEYGGNYGQSEEEVFSKVLQGMTVNDGKYGGIKDFEKNYYRYQIHDDAYTNSYTTRRTDPRYPSSSMPVYRPVKTPLPYDSKYRNTEFKYPDLPTTPNYYERQKPSEFQQNNVDRQFVVGNVPKDYPSDEKKLSTTTETIQTDFEKQIAQNLRFVQNPTNLVTNYGQPEAQPLKADNYDEIEITPTAVAVEHGPRSLKLEKLDAQLQEIKKRMKRESVIQMIPPRSELDKEEDEEPLSNEILDIIDSALPENMIKNDKKDRTDVDDKKIHEIEVKKESTTLKPREELTTTVESATSRAKETEVEESSTKVLPTTSPVSTSSSTKSSFVESTSPGIEPESETIPTDTNTPEGGGFNVFNFVRRVAEVKFRLGLTILKHASESFARYLGHVQKRINGEE